MNSFLIDHIFLNMDTHIDSSVDLKPNTTHVIDPPVNMKLVIAPQIDVKPNVTFGCGFFQQYQS
jgi:uncharacterized membrane protein (UPF0127 family)